MDFDNTQPIYKQIIDGYKKQLIRGELQQGDKIPSQREYAEKLRVNPNTVQRAYREMESMQMVETVRGQGTFIMADLNMQNRFRQEMADALLSYFIREIGSLGYTGEEALQMLAARQAAMKEESCND